jgi:hypothetical protein
VEAAVELLERLLGSGFELVAGAGRRVDPALLALGVALHLLADAVRNRGWLTILRAAHPADRGLRLRDVEAAAFAGGGLNAVVPARGGDVVKLALVRSRMPSADFGTLTGTLVPETAFELIAGAGLLAWALASGYLPVEPVSGSLAHARSSFLVPLAAGVAGGALLLGVTRRGLARVYHRLRPGLAVLCRPRLMVLGVVTWQLAGRAIRLAAIASCLAACGLPAGAEAALVTMAIDGGSRIRLGPATAGLRIGLLAYGLGAAEAGVATVAVVAYVTAVASLRTLAGVAISLGILGARLHTRSPRRALSAARALAGNAVEPRPDPLPARNARL